MVEELFGHSQRPDQATKEHYIKGSNELLIEIKRRYIFIRTNEVTFSAAFLNSRPTCPAAGAEEDIGKDTTFSDNMPKQSLNLEAIQSDK